MKKMSAHLFECVCVCEGGKRKRVGGQGEMSTKIRIHYSTNNY